MDGRIDEWMDEWILFHNIFSFKALRHYVQLYGSEKYWTHVNTKPEALETKKKKLRPLWPQIKETQ